MTETDVCNLALGMLGHDRAITGDFRTATSTEALRCRLHFDACRRRVLSCRDWMFAEDRVTLYGAEGCGGAASVMQAMRLPGDCLNVIRAHLPGRETDPVGWEPRAGHAIACDRAPSVIVYIRDVTDMDLWPQQPLDAFAAELAASLAGALTASVEKTANAKKEARAVLDDATVWNARQFPRRVQDPRRYERSRS